MFLLRQHQPYNLCSRRLQHTAMAYLQVSLSMVSSSDTEGLPCTAPVGKCLSARKRFLSDKLLSKMPQRTKHIDCSDADTTTDLTSTSPPSRSSPERSFFISLTTYNSRRDRIGDQESLGINDLTYFACISRTHSRLTTPLSDLGHTGNSNPAAGSTLKITPISPKDGRHEETTIQKWGELLCKTARKLGCPMSSDFCDLFIPQIGEADFVDVQQRNFYVGDQRIH